MKILSTCAMGALLALGLATSTSAQVVRMTATLSSGEETPALLSGAAGQADLAVDVANSEVTVTLNVVNIPTTTSAGHIHIGPKGVAGPVVLDFPAIAGRLGDFAVTFRVNQGAFRPQPAIGINSIADAIQAITLGNAYVNIHTTTNPAGEIRGQVTLAP